MNSAVSSVSLQLNPPRPFLQCVTKHWTRLVATLKGNFFETPRKFEQRDEIFSLKCIQIVDKYQRQRKEEERQTWELCNFCSPICLTNWLSPEVMS